MLIRIKSNKPLFTLHKYSLEQNFINYSRRCIGVMIFQRKSIVIILLKHNGYKMYRQV
jgi:hypothetical protein